MARLDRQVRAEVAAFTGRVSLFAKNLETGSSYGLAEETRVQTASTIKIAIMVEAFAQVAEGHLGWGDTLRMTEADKVGGSGVLREMTAGLSLTLMDAVTLMTIISDNTATNLILDRLTADAVNDRLDGLGLPEIRSLNKINGGAPSRAASDPANQGFGSGVATALSMVALMEKLGRGQIVSPETSAEMIALLKRQQRRDGIGRSRPDLPLASKPGGLDLLRSDVGILYTEWGPVAMAITCDQLPQPLWTPDNPAFLLMAHLSELIAEGLGNPTQE